VFRHTGISPLTRIPAIVGYELDQRTLLSPAGTRLIGAGAAPCMGVTERGEPIPGPGNNRAETTLYTARSGALVFATGTLGWALGPALDPRVAAITRNLLAHVLARGCGPPARPWCGG
jgi:hypothetical protein